MSRSATASQRRSPSSSSDRVEAFVIRLVALLILLATAVFVYQRPQALPSSTAELKARGRTAIDRIHRHSGALRAQLKRSQQAVLEEVGGWAGKTGGSVDADEAAREQERADEALGQLWAASKASRAAAQARGEGTYGMKGDGTHQAAEPHNLDDLDEADPDAKAGFDAETWKAIKGALSGDDLAQMLDAVHRRSEL